MGFFNKKEDVLEFQLTEYGKRLLQEGNLKPEFYAFYDEDVLYDTNAGGYTEAQNSSARRIKYETPSLKVQANTTGVETRVNEFLQNVTGGANSAAFASTISENSVEFVNAFQNTPHFAQKYFLASDPLGNSDLKSEYAPAWHINCLANEISSSKDYYTVNLTSSGGSLGENIVRQIPQLDITVDYKTFFSTEADMNLLQDVTIAPVPEFESLNNVVLYVQENYLVLEVMEQNTDYMKENFDIEVFQSGSDGGLTKLQFVNDQNLLAPTGDGNVEHYLNVFVDSEIPQKAVNATELTQNMLEGTSVRIQLNRDLYQTTENEEPC